MVAAGYQLGLTSDRSLRKKNESHLNQKFIHSSSPARSAVEDDFLAPVSINHVSCILYHKCIRYHKSCITSVSYSHQLTILQVSHLANRSCATKLLCSRRTACRKQQNAMDEARVGCTGRMPSLAGERLE